MLENKRRLSTYCQNQGLHQHTLMLGGRSDCSCCLSLSAYWTRRRLNT